MSEQESSEEMVVKEQGPSEYLEGYVAQILNARELVINIGSDAGVEPGMKFAVLAEQPIEVRDPRTNEVLDSIDREKVRVEATEVRPKITICRTYRTRREGGGAAYQAFLGAAAAASMFNPPRVITETLAAKDSSLPPPLSPEDSYVKINDRVIEVEEDEE